MLKPYFVEQNLNRIQLEAKTDWLEVAQYYNRMLNFVQQHTSADGEKAIRIALNETKAYFNNP